MIPQLDTDWVIFLVTKGFNTITERVAQALREELRQGRWQGTMPGPNRLAAELEGNQETVKTAVAILDRDSRR